jgi:ABC-type multidrug transport system fused ATPase/permease subunit
MMNPNDVRSRFITLPQEPLLISGTVRHNMQLYEPDCQDQELVAALDDFGLWDTIQSKGGLDAVVNEELLSHGQRQLLCFARSTIQRGNIVILDEPSSQSDRETEQKMDRAIREKFKHHTVLCIAHKLSTIMSCDSVIVMDSGSISESGNPRELLRDTSSLFSALMNSQRDQSE